MLLNPTLSSDNGDSAKVILPTKPNTQASVSNAPLPHHYVHTYKPLQIGGYHLATNLPCTHTQTVRNYLIIMPMRCEAYLITMLPCTRVQTIHNHLAIAPMRCEAHLVTMSLHTQVQTIHDHLIIVLMRREVHLAIAPMRREVHLVTALMQRRVHLVATSPHILIATLPPILVATSPHTRVQTICQNMVFFELLFRPIRPITRRLPITFLRFLLFSYDFMTL